MIDPAPKAQVIKGWTELAAAAFLAVAYSLQVAQNARRCYRLGLPGATLNITSHIAKIV